MGPQETASKVTECTSRTSNRTLSSVGPFSTLGDSEVGCAAGDSDSHLREELGQLGVYGTGHQGG